MTARQDNIERLLSTLARHAEIISDAFAGPVTGGDRAREAAITALVGVGALKAYEEGSYYLSTPLYEYFNSVLASFNAFQALTRIRGHVHQANGQWDELLMLRSTGATKEMPRLEAALERTVIEIGEIVERNITLLNSMVLGQYGNVQDHAAKLRQNRFYAKEVKMSLSELGQVEGLVQKLSDSASGERLGRIRQLVVRRLGSSLLPWSSRLKDAQSIISRRLFEARLMERRLKQLARYAGWLAANPTQSGWDVDVDETVDPALCRPRALKIRPQPDFSEPVVVNMTRLIEAANRLPKEEAAGMRPRRDQRSPDDDIVISDELRTIEVAMQPHEVAFQMLCEELAQRSLAGDNAPVSLAAWKTKIEVDLPDLVTMPLEHWLIHAARQLVNRDYQLRFVTETQTEPFLINTRFNDIQAVHVRRGGQDEARQAQRLQEA